MTFMWLGEGKEQVICMVKIPLHAAIECIMTALKSEGDGVEVHEWYDSSYFSKRDIARRILDMRKLCIFAAYSTTRSIIKHELLKHVVFRFYYGNDGNAKSTIPEFWRENIRFVKRVVVMVEHVWTQPSTESLSFLLQAHEIVFKGCELGPESLKFIGALGAARWRCQTTVWRCHKMFFSYCVLPSDIRSLDILHTIGLAGCHSYEAPSSPDYIDCSGINSVHTFMSNLTALGGIKDMMGRVCKVGGVTPHSQWGGKRWHGLCDTMREK